MVVVVRKEKSKSHSLWMVIPLVFSCSAAWLLFTIFSSNADRPVLSNADPSGGLTTTDAELLLRKHEMEQQMFLVHRAKPQCPFMNIHKDLTEEQIYATAGNRHMVDPPPDYHLILVCCQTTVGPWSILVHYNWAPNGAGRFLEMVRDGYFNQQKVPLFRCVAGFLCQFGLAGSASKPFAKTIPDDHNWLPEGKDHRENEQGVKRFARGYLAYAGSGEHSRNNQFIVALAPNGPLGGGSPWEIPWGELVGDHSYETLSKVYTGYGEKGPSQARLWKEDYLSFLEQNFPSLDYILSCDVVDEITL